MVSRRRVVVLVSAAVLLAAVTSVIATDRVAQTLAIGEGEARAGEASDSPEAIRMASELLVRKLGRSEVVSGDEGPPKASPVRVDPARFIVTDSKGTPIPKASIAILHLKRLQAHGVADQDGTWSAVSSSQPAWKTVYVSAIGYADSETYLEVVGGKTYGIVLEKEEVLRGSVVMSGGLPAPLRTNVIAWAGVTPPTEYSLKALDVGVRTFLHARTNAAGVFAIRGARRGATYTVCAGGSGWTSVEWSHNVKASLPPIRLEVWRVYGGFVITSVNGYKILPAITAGSTGYDFEGFDEEDSGVTDLTYPSLTLAMAGIRKTRPKRVSDFWAHEDVFIAKRYQESDVFPVEMNYSVPGIEKRKVLVLLRPVSGARIPKYEVRLNATVRGFGDLLMVFEGGPSFGHLKLRNNFAQSGSMANLQLSSVDGGAGMMLSVPRLGGSPYLIQGIPYGEYQALFVTAGGMGLRASQGKMVQIGPKRASLTWRLDALGALLVVPRTLDPLTRDDGLKAVLTPFGSKASRSFYFGEAPYLLMGLIPGKYRVDIAQSTDAGWKNTARLNSIEIGASELTQAVFSWPKR